MDDLDALDRVGVGPFRFDHEGQRWLTPDPSTIGWERLMQALQQQIIPGTPRMEKWRANRLFERWRQHHDLPDFDHARRLAFLVGRYRRQLEVDLRVVYREDLTTLWSSRRWRALLNLIDHLPRNTYYSEAVANDEEHAKALAEAAEARRGETEGEDPGPPMHLWDQNAAMTAELIDAVHGLTFTVAAANGAKNLKPPNPYTRPKTAIDKMKRQVYAANRQKQHEALVARLLPHKAENAG